MTETKIIIFKEEAEYRKFFNENFVEIQFTFCGFPIYFENNDFDHIFYEPRSGGGNIFSRRRAKKMIFIKSILDENWTEKEILFEECSGNIAIFCKELDCVIYLRKRKESFQIGTFFDFGEHHEKGYSKQRKKCREITKEEIEKLFIK
jgi:hypothetical protein